MLLRKPLFSSFYFKLEAFNRRGDSSDHFCLFWPGLVVLNGDYNGVLCPSLGCLSSNQQTLLLPRDVDWFQYHSDALHSHRNQHKWHLWAALCAECSSSRFPLAATWQELHVSVLLSLRKTPRHASDWPPLLTHTHVNTQYCSSPPQTQHSHCYFCSTDW